jgi:predicted ATPase
VSCELPSAFEAAASGDGRLVILVGEPGIGKTVVCNQLASFVGAQGGLALVGRYYPEAPPTSRISRLSKLSEPSHATASPRHCARSWA